MFSPVSIKDRLDYTGIEITLEEIKDIVYNIDELGGDMISYYNECTEAYNNQLKTNNNILKEKAISENQFMIDEIKQMISECVDNGEKARYMQQLDKYLNTMNSLLKDVVFNEEEKEMEVLNSNTDKIERANKSVSFMISEEFVN